MYAPESMSIAQQPANPVISNAQIIGTSLVLADDTIPNRILVGWPVTGHNFGTTSARFWPVSACGPPPLSNANYRPKGPRRLVSNSAPPKPSPAAVAPMRP